METRVAVDLEELLAYVELEEVYQRLFALAFEQLETVLMQHSVESRDE